MSLISPSGYLGSVTDRYILDAGWKVQTSCGQGERDWTDISPGEARHAEGM
jgi:hypothetical protein